MAQIRLAFLRSRADLTISEGGWSGSIAVSLPQNTWAAGSGQERRVGLGKARSLAVGFGALFFLLIAHYSVFAMQIIESISSGDPLLKAPFEIHYIRIAHILQRERSQGGTATGTAVKNNS